MEPRNDKRTDEAAEAAKAAQSVDEAAKDEAGKGQIDLLNWESLKEKIMAKARSTTSGSTTGSTKGRKPAAAAKAPSRARKKGATSKADSKKADMKTDLKMKSSSTVNDTVAIVTPEDRQRMIQDAAYHIAEKDGFQSGREQEYWFRAEKQIDQLIQGQRVLATGAQQADTVDTDIH